jgi:hypothetical protein
MGLRRQGVQPSPRRWAEAASSSAPPGPGVAEQLAGLSKEGRTAERPSVFSAIISSWPLPAA